MRNTLYGLFSLLLLACNQGDPHTLLGTLERNRISHRATMAEVVVDLPVQTGTFVKKGHLLVQLDTQLQRAKVAKARAELTMAQASFDKLRHGARTEEVAAAAANVAGAKAVLKENEAKFARMSDLLVKQLASQSDYDQALAARDAGRANLKSAEEALLTLTNGTREEDLRFAQAQIDAAKANLTSEQKSLADLSVRAKRDGILDNLPWNLGERVTAGSPVAIVSAGKAPYARIYVPEPYRGLLKVNQTLKVKIDGIDRPISGKLRWISSEPAFTPYYALNQQERSRLMYLAEVQLPDSQNDLPNGIPAQVFLP